MARDGIRSVEDLLLHLPMRYEDRRRLTAIGDLQVGVPSVVVATVVSGGLRRARRMTLYEARVEDPTGRLRVIWFNQPYMRDALPAGSRVVLSGVAQRDPRGGRALVMSSPEHEVLDEQETEAQTAGRILPVYERIGSLSSRLLRRLIASILDGMSDEITDPLPEELRRRQGLCGRGDALRGVHAPADDTDLDALGRSRSGAHLRLIFEECFLFQLGLARRRSGPSEPNGIRFDISDATRESVKRILPFPLTGAQKRVLREIADDMRRPRPMNRLVQGDVGSGKTLVALLAMVIAVESGYQAAFMAPTEILAEQHFLTFRRLLRGLPHRVVYLGGGGRGPERNETLAAIASGEAVIAVGTHALVQEGVRFHRLGLAVVDEQHRFGVLQRDILARKGHQADVLVMTATPIPRTLALTAFGDLDVSVVDEKPPGRSPIQTIHRGAGDRRAVTDLVRRELEAGRQGFVVYPLVLESDKLEDVRAAAAAADEWRAHLPGFGVDLLHGRLRSADKERVMGAFAAGKTRLLVATTVVEVGIDVANATIMVIEHAERFGLAQLHQLRGRVGRGPVASTCVLVTHGRLSDVARARVDAMLGTNDGFEIAERDLEIRGPGDFFGTRQSGLPSFRVTELLRDGAFLERAREEAFRYARAQPFESWPAPVKALFEGGAWDRRFGLSLVG